MSEAEPEEIANQVVLHREARWLRSSTRGLINGLQGIERSQDRGPVPGQDLRFSISPSHSAGSSLQHRRMPGPAQVGRQGPPTVRRVAPPRARSMSLASHPSSHRTILILDATRAGLVWRPGAGPHAAGSNTAFAQSPPGKAASGHPLRVSLRGAPMRGARPSRLPRMLTRSFLSLCVLNRCPD